MIRISARPQIGRLDVVRMDMEAGRSLMDYAAVIAPQMPPGFFTAGVAMIDDSDPIPPEMWLRVKPKAGRSVSFAIVPQGSGGSGQMLAQIGLIAAQGLLKMIPGVGPLLSAAVGIGGSLLMAKMAEQEVKPEKRTQPKQLGEAGFSDNSLRPYDQFPTVVGTRRVPARYIAPPFLSRDRDNETGVAIIGLAGRHELRDPLVDGAQLDAIDTFTREGDSSDPDPKIYKTVAWQEAGRTLSNVNVEYDVDANIKQTMINSDNGIPSVIKYDLPKWQYYRLGNVRTPNRMVLDFTLDQGLASLSSGGAVGDAVIPLRMKFSKPGQADKWLPMLIVRLKDNSGQPTRLQLIIEFAANPGGFPANPTKNVWRQAYANTGMQNLTGGGTYPAAVDCSADTYYGTGAVASNVIISAPNKCTIYAPPQTLGIDGTWRFGIQRGCGVPVVLSGTTYFRVSDAQYNRVGGSNVFENTDLFGFYNAVPSIPAISEAIEDQIYIVGNTLTLDYVTRIHDIPPVDATGIATFEVQTQNQRVDQLTVLASRYVDKAWNGTAWIDQPHVSSNPAEIAYDICTNASPALLQRPLPATLIDAAEFGAWADFCTAQGYECNAYLTDLTVEQALQIVFQAGHAYLRRSQTWGVVIERSRASESPVHVFSPRNSRRFTITKTFEHKPHALRVTFDDEDDDFQTRPDLLVYAPGYDETNARLFESVSYPGITREWQAIRRAQRDLAIRYYRNKAYSLETDTRYLVCERGSLVGINHVVLNSAHGFASIREVRRQVIGGVTKITGLVLDTEIDMQPTTTGIAISTDNGAVTVATVASTGASRLREITFAASLTDDANIREGCTVTCGAVGLEYIRAIVDDIQAGADFTAQLTLYDEAPEIFTAYGY